MASNAAHLVFGVAAGDAADMSRLVLMACEANAVRVRGRQLGRLADVGGGNGLGVFTTWPVARLASLSFPPAFLAGFHQLVPAFEQSVIKILVARLAGLRPDVFPGLAGLSAGASLG
jgi:hypothetical protein